MGTVQVYTRGSLKVSRLIGDGSLEEINRKAQKFVDEVSVVATPIVTQLESNRAGLCVATYIRCHSDEEMKATMQRFKDNGWRVA